MTFLSNFAANLAADVVVAGLVFVLVEWRWNLRNENKRRVDQSEVIVGQIRTELLSNQERLTTQLADPGHVHSPLVTMHGFTLLLQAPVFATLDKDLLDKLTTAYSLTDSVVTMHGQLLKLSGPDAIMAGGIPATGKVIRKEIIELFAEAMREALAAYREALMTIDAT